MGGCAGRLAVVNQETDRRTLNRRVDERTLQELYLPAFETAVRDGQPWAVVCSAGQLNGTRICEDTALLTDTLRGAWALPVRCWRSRARCRTRPGRWPRAWILPCGRGTACGCRAVRRTGRVRFKPRCIEHYTHSFGRIDPAVPADRTADRSLAVELAKQSGVLLRNLGALPLHKGRR